MSEERLNGLISGLSQLVHQFSSPPQKKPYNRRKRKRAAAEDATDEEPTCNHKKIEQSIVDNKEKKSDEMAYFKCSKCTSFLSWDFNFNSAKAKDEKKFKKEHNKGKKNLCNCGYQLITVGKYKKCPANACSYPKRKSQFSIPAGTTRTSYVDWKKENVPTN